MMATEVRRSRPGGRSGSGLRGSKAGQSFSQKAGRVGRPGGGGDSSPGQVEIDPAPAASSPRDSSPSLAPVTSPSSHTARPPQARAYI